ncbi:hypothetical protein [Roseobacter sp. HKCCA0434]|uniref:hypothetical protein n=1 Tax=Roseobacter sp. HKCCA0434 TaxID=3079297 RepID=UPI00290587AF|nr:hypothetical protein [Roseobacter sp. HKCCA0434]
MRTATLTLAICLMALPAAARNFIRSDEGRDYAQTRNQYGVVLQGAGEVIYLGESCDIESPQRGTGKWGLGSEQVLLDFTESGLTLAPTERFLGRDIVECAL